MSFEKFLYGIKYFQKYSNHKIKFTKIGEEKKQSKKKN